RAGMVTVADDLALTVERLVHAARDPDAEAAQARGERGLAAGLHDEVKMMRLNREGDDPEAGPATGMAVRDRAHGAPDGTGQSAPAQGRETLDDAPGDVLGMVPVMERPPAMGYADAAPGPWPPRARPAAAMLVLRGDVKLELRAHWNEAY